MTGRRLPGHHVPDFGRPRDACRTRYSINLSNESSVDLDAPPRFIGGLFENITTVAALLVVLSIPRRTYGQVWGARQRLKRHWKELGLAATAALIATLIRLLT